MMENLSLQLTYNIKKSVKEKVRVETNFLSSQTLQELSWLTGIWAVAWRCIQHMEALYL